MKLSVVDFINSYYFYNWEWVEDQMERYLQAIDAKKIPMFVMQGQVQFLNPVLGTVPDK